MNHSRAGAILDKLMGRALQGLVETGSLKVHRLKAFPRLEVALASASYHRIDPFMLNCAPRTGKR